MASRHIATQANTEADPPSFDVDQRRAPRYTLLLRQAKLRTRQGEFLCVIRDLSVTGISIRTFHPLPSGNRFAIELRDGCPHLLEKVWERDGEAGLRFRDPVALDEMLDDDARFPRRQMRVNVSLPLDVYIDGAHQTATCVNLSQQGARLETDTIWAKDQLLRLKAPMMPDLFAKVRWRRDCTHGVVFEETFSFRDFAYLLARLQGVV